MIFCATPRNCCPTDGATTIQLLLYVAHHVREINFVRDLLKHLVSNLTLLRLQLCRIRTSSGASGANHRRALQGSVDAVGPKLHLSFVRVCITFSIILLRLVKNIFFVRKPLVMSAKQRMGMRMGVAVGDVSDLHRAMTVVLSDRFLLQLLLAFLEHEFDEFVPGTLFAVRRVRSCDATGAGSFDFDFFHNINNILILIHLLLTRRRAIQVFERRHHESPRRLPRVALPQFICIVIFRVGPSPLLMSIIEQCASDTCVHFVLKFFLLLLERVERTLSVSVVVKFR